jgi:hypothetical protein
VAGRRARITRGHPVVPPQTRVHEPASARGDVIKERGKTPFHEHSGRAPVPRFLHTGVIQALVDGERVEEEVGAADGKLCAPVEKILPGAALSRGATGGSSGGG